MSEIYEEQSQRMQLVQREELADDEDLFEMINNLVNDGINAGDVKKLQDADIYTCKGLLMHTKKSLTGITGLSEAKVDKICKAVQKMVNYGYITGSDALLKRKSVVCITTGRQSLDELLAGGIETSAITETFGEFRSGKTQPAHTLCVTTQPTQLQDAGIYTCKGLLMHTKKGLTGITGLSEAKVDKICKAVQKMVNYGYITGSDALLKRKSVVRITTGSQSLDELLAGGIETSAITETFGEFRSGKTQLAHTLSASTQLPPSMNGRNGNIAYIDTDGTFRPDCIVAIAEKFGMDATSALHNIIYARAYTYEHLNKILLELAQKMAEGAIQLLIVDSVVPHFQVGPSGRGEVAGQVQNLAKMLSCLIKIADEFHVALYVTSQIIFHKGGVNVAGGGGDNGDNRGGGGGDNVGTRESVGDNISNDHSEPNDENDDEEDHHNEQLDNGHDEQLDGHDIEDDADDPMRIRVFLEVYHPNDVVQEVLVGTLDYEVCVDLETCEELDAMVEDVIRGNPQLPNPHDIFYQTSLEEAVEEAVRGYISLPTSYYFLIRQTHRILVGRSLD